jgi:hypothetical protein
VSTSLRSVLVSFLLGACLLGIATPSAAQPSWYIDVFGQANTAVVNGPVQRVMTLTHDSEFVNPNSFQPIQQANFTGNTSAAGRGTITYDPATGKAPSIQAADASASLSASVGGLRGAVGAANTVSDYAGPQQFVFGSSSVSVNWIDTLTFHTANPLGADFRVSVTLDDSLSTSLVPSSVAPNGFEIFPGQTDSYAMVHTLLAMFAESGPSFTASDNFLHIEDSVRQDADHRDPVSGLPLLTIASPPSRTLSAIVHIFDGTVIRFEQDLTLGAGVDDGNGVAGANASDTAFMNLVALDPDATYSAASGTVFATEGDPFAPVTAPVPEPSELALMTSGLAALTFLVRRRRRAR